MVTHEEEYITNAMIHPDPTILITQLGNKKTVSLRQSTDIFRMATAPPSHIITVQLMRVEHTQDCNGDVNMGVPWGCIT